MSPQWVQAERENPRVGVLGATGVGIEKDPDITHWPQKSIRDRGKVPLCGLPKRIPWHHQTCLGFLLECHAKAIFVHM